MDDKTREQWPRTAGPIKVEIEGLEVPLLMSAKLFKSGSVGWYLSQKATMSDTVVQIGFCITVVKSGRKWEEANGTLVQDQPFPLVDGPYSPSEAPKAPEPVQKAPKAPKGTPRGNK